MQSFFLPVSIETLVTGENTEVPIGSSLPGLGCLTTAVPVLRQQSLRGVVGVAAPLGPAGSASQPLLVALVLTALEVG